MPTLLSVFVCVLQTVLDNSSSPYAQLMAATNLLKLATEHTLRFVNQHGIGIGIDVRIMRTCICGMPDPAWGSYALISLPA